MDIQTLIATGKNAIAWRFEERRPLLADEIRVRNRFGTEKHGTMKAILKGFGEERGKMDEQLGLYFGTGVAWNYPLPLGNMNYGEITEIGDAVEERRVGDMVAISAPFQPESVVRAQDSFRVPPHVSWKTAFLQDPGEFALGALRDGHVRIGDHVVIFSLGAIGLTCVQMAKAAGAGCVIGIDPVPSRRAAALRCGADFALGEDLNDLGWQVRQHARRDGVDVVIDFSGSIPAMQAAFRALAPLGTLVLGAYPDVTTATLDLGRESHHNQLNIVFTRACSEPLRDHPRWDWHRIRRATWHALTSGPYDGSFIVDDPFPFSDLLDAYPVIAESPGDRIKISVAYP